MFHVLPQAVREQPQDWMPWTFRATLAKRNAAPFYPAAAPVRSHHSVQPVVMNAGASIWPAQQEGRWARCVLVHVLAALLVAQPMMVFAAQFKTLFPKPVQKMAHSAQLYDSNRCPPRIVELRPFAPPPSYYPEFFIVPGGSRGETNEKNRKAEVTFDPPPPQGGNGYLIRFDAQGRPYIVLSPSGSDDTGCH